MGDYIGCPVFNLAGLNITAAVQVYADVAAAKFESDSGVFTAFNRIHLIEQILRADELTTIAVLQGQDSGWRQAERLQDCDRYPTPQVGIFRQVRSGCVGGRVRLQPHRLFIGFDHIHNGTIAHYAAVIQPDGALADADQGFIGV